MSRGPLILYIPGLKPKPEHSLHREQVLRCMLEGIRRIDAQTADEMAQDEHFFDMVSWTYDFYGVHRDINLDLADIEAIIKKTEASAADKEVATSWKRRFIRSLYRAADHLPFLIPHFANEDVELQIRDLHRYAKNVGDIAEIVRREVKIRLRAAASAGRPLLLFGHSMGSVIGYDTLWQLSHQPGEEVRIDLMVTTGSPLGQRLIQRRLKGYRNEGIERYPRNIRRWTNIAAIGELTAIDMALKNDFGEMIRLGLVEDIEDIETYNYYRMNGVLNVHTEYGYLVNEVTAMTIRNWWREVS
jgi:surfactin synthase thioesterase subunit